MTTLVTQNKRNFVGGMAILAVLAGVLTVFLTGGSTRELLYGLGAGIVLAAIVLGVYALARRAGHPHSHAVAEAAVTIGLLYIVALVYRLLTQFGA